MAKSTPTGEYLDKTISDDEMSNFGNFNLCVDYKHIKS